MIGRKGYFTIEECMANPDMRKPNASVPLHVADMLHLYHFSTLNPIREDLGVPIIISKHSGFRYYDWEIMKGRSGRSQHTFGQRFDGTFDPQCAGALDLTSDKLLELLRLLRIFSTYKRICYYEKDGFIHGDFRSIVEGKRRYYEYNYETQEWDFKEFI